jgi:uncharacterized protein YdeI (YjbR/CyaY-like superfamily)
MVDDFITKNSQWAKLLSTLREIVLDCNLTETVKWNSPVYSFRSKNVVGLGAFKSYAGLWLFNGNQLEDLSSVLVNTQEGQTKAMRQWRFQLNSNINPDLVKLYVQEAISLVKDNKIPFIRPNSAIPITPPILTAQLAVNKTLKTQFDSLTAYKQKEYCEFIASAKKETTQLNRLNKSIGLILNGCGLHDHYR